MPVLHELVPFAVFGFPAAVAVTFRWFKHRERLAAAAPGGDARRVAELEARLARTEQMLDAVMVETERVSEGQRFVTRLLAERPPAEPAGYQGSAAGREWAPASPSPGQYPGS